MIILTALLPLIICAVTGCICTMIGQRSKAEGTEAKKSFSSTFLCCMKKMILTAAIGAVTILCCNLAIVRFMNHTTSGLPIGIAVFVSVLLCAPYVLDLFPNLAKLRRLVRAASVIAVCLAVAETFVFNLKCFTLNQFEYTFSADEIRAEGSVYEADGTFKISGLSGLIIDQVPSGTRSLVIDLKQEKLTDSLRFCISLMMKDQNFRIDYQTARIDYTIGYSGEHVFTFKPYEPIHSLRLLIEDVTNPVTISAVHAYSAAPFVFSLLRYFLLFVLCTACAAIKIFAVYRMTCSEWPWLTNLLFNIVMVICAFSCALFTLKDAQPTPYDKNEPFFGYDPFVATFDAIQHNRAYIIYPVDPALSQMVNPYDFSERSTYNGDFGWDLAYKDGHYYSYFGVAPVLTYYFPYYWLTGNLPAMNYANTTYGFFAVVFLCLTLYALMKLMIPDANLLAFLCMLPVSVATAGIYCLLNFANNYNLPVMSGMCFLLMSLWLGVSACGKDLRKGGRLAALFFSGLALGLCAASRPGMAIGAAMLIPLFLGILFRKNEKISYRVLNVVMFALPLLACVVGILMYNQARFGSFLDFGQEYQLTVSDIHANRLDFTDIPGAFYTYFVQSPKPKLTFPYFDLEFFEFFNYGKKWYAAQSIGALSIPFVLLGTLYIPYAISRKKKTAGTVSETVCEGKVTALQKNAFVIVCFVSALFIAWQDYCLGGVIRRYSMDFMPLMTIGSCVTVLHMLHKEKNNKFRYVLVFGAMAASFIMMVLLELGYRDGNICRCCPNLYDTVAKLIQFWR